MECDLRGHEALVIAAASERHADLLYATRFRAPDPFVFVQLPRESVLMVSDLELDRARAQACVDRVLASSRYERQLRQMNCEPTFGALLLALLRDLGVTDLLVPADFELHLADQLRAAGLRLEPAVGPVFPQRQIKTPAEIDAIRTAIRAAEDALKIAIEALRRASITAGVLMLEGAPLTSERLRRRIHQCLLDHDCTAAHTIVAGGDQGCDPHQEGHGPLRAHEPIIIDIFPQSLATGYFGDITRTVMRGTASAALRRQYAAVQAAQELALARLAAGADGALVHRQVQNSLAEAGYATGEVDGHMQGFFHGTGHGVGLEIHEPPRLGARGDQLQDGHVVTVEPGLYYRGVGGVRLEDTVVVRPHGCDNLAVFPKQLEV